MHAWLVIAALGSACESSSTSEAGGSAAHDSNGGSIATTSGADSSGSSSSSGDPGSAPSQPASGSAADDGTTPETPSVGSDGVGDDAASGNGEGSNGEGTLPGDVPTASSSDSSEADAELAACIAYAEAYCKRDRECAGTSSEVASAQCVTASFGCPDVAFSEGSTRTPEGMLACAREVSAYPCEPWVNGELPACIAPGTIASGEPCTFHSQCATGWCSGNSVLCGVCKFEAGPDDDCREDRFFCPLGSACAAATDRCEAAPRVVPPTPSEAAPTESVIQAQMGDPCDPAIGCASGLDCARQGDVRVCTPYPSVGEDCSVPRTCAANSYCELDGLTCRELPALGQACGVDGWTGTAGWCALDTVCQRESERVGTCVAYPEVGAPCVTWDDGDELRGICGEGARCNLTLSPPLCESGGALCSEHHQCGTGACLCETPDCETRSCLRALALGAACPVEDAACRPGAACLDGACRATGSVGVFAEFCGAE